MMDESHKPIELLLEPAGRSAGGCVSPDRLPDFLDRHAAGPRQNHIALRRVSSAGCTQDLTYRQLRCLTNHFANVLRNLGIGSGERVATLAGPLPELCVAALGTVKNQCIFCPLEATLDAQALQCRLAAGKVRVLLTTEQVYRDKVAPCRSTLPALERVLLIGDSNRRTFEPGTENYQQLLATASGSSSTDGAAPKDLALLHFTSCSLQPEQILLSHEATLAHLTNLAAAKLLPDDVCWCTAAPGTLAWTLNGLLAPIQCGATGLIREAEFDPENAYRLVADLKINVWNLTTDHLRRLRETGAALARRHNVQSLRFLTVAGAPASPTDKIWATETFGVPVHQSD